MDGRKSALADAWANASPEERRAFCRSHQLHALYPDQAFAKSADAAPAAPSPNVQKLQPRDPEEERRLLREGRERLKPRPRLSAADLEPVQRKIPTK
jgi:hypothetical protein